jgi:CheY-like chemotaxis protein
VNDSTAAQFGNGFMTRDTREDIIMETKEVLLGKRVLLVDDEPDVLNLLTELLSVCMLDRATGFEEARQLLETQYYDIAVLDIMGVRGFELLEIAKSRHIPSLMLTAHALSDESLKRSAEGGASYFVPKEEIGKIEVFVADVIEAIEEKKNPWLRWYERLGSFFNEKFSGPNWREQAKEFWDEKLKEIPNI